MSTPGEIFSPWWELKKIMLSHVNIGANIFLLRLKYLYPSENIYNPVEILIFLGGNISIPVEIFTPH